MTTTPPFDLIQVGTTSTDTVSYLDSTILSGYYAGTSSINGNWLSLTPYITTNINNALATTSYSALNILYPGIYELNVSLNFISGSDGTDPNTSSFFFSTSQQLYNSSNAYDGFGGTNVQTYNCGGSNQSNPGILNWSSSLYNTGNTANGSQDTFGISNNFLVCNYYGKVGSTGLFYPGISTTKMTFTVNDLPVNDTLPIYFNLKINNSCTIGDSYFTLKMISSTPAFSS